MIDAMFNEKSASFLTMVKKLEKADCENIKPHTGGKQLSFRLDDLTIIKLDEIANRVGWTRSDVMTVLLCKGLHFMYERLDRDTLKSLAESFNNALEGKK